MEDNKQNIIKDMYYDPVKTLSYNKFLNFVLSNRGAGKSYGWKCKPIKDFKKRGWQWIYLRRYDTEFDELNEYFADVKHEFPDDVLEVRGNKFYINDELAGFAISLSTSQKLKSSSFPGVKWIIYDEFIIDTGGVYRYLKNEVRLYLDFYDTVDRSRDEVIGVFLANTITVVNPYFLYFDVVPKEGKMYTVKGDILVEVFLNEKFVKMKEKTRFGKITKNTEYGNYNMQNKFLLDNDTFIQAKSPKSRYYFSFIYKSNLFGVWIDWTIGKMYVSENVDPYCKICYSFTIDDHSPNTMLFKNLSKTVMVRNFVENFKLGNVYFESIKLKNITYEIIKMALI